MGDSYYILRYSLTPKAIIDRVKSTGNQSPDVSLKVSHGDEQFDRAVDLLGIDNLSGTNRHFPISVPGKFDSADVSVSALLDRVEAEEREKEAEYEDQREKYEEAVQKLLTCDPKSVLCNRCGSQSAVENPASEDSEWAMPKGEWFLFPSEGSRTTSHHHPLMDARLEGLRSQAESLIREQATRIAKQKDEESRKAIKEVGDWIAANGSARLKRCFSEGLSFDAIYRDERLSVERPGWSWYDSVPGLSKEPRNPSENAFDVLDAARKTEPKAVLRYHVIKESDDDENEEWRGYTAEAEFLGRTICFGVPE